MLNLAKLFVITTVILLGDYYIGITAFSVRAISVAILAAAYFMRQGIKEELSGDTRNLLRALWIFMLYVFISDALKDNIADAAVNSLSFIIASIILIAFENDRSRFALYKALFTVYSVSFAFAALQTAGLNANLTTLCPGIGPIQSSWEGFRILAESGATRVSGATNSNVAFAEQTGILIIILFYRLVEGRGLILLAPLAAMAGMLFCTQTRSAIYGVVPAIFAARLLFGRKKMKELAWIVFVFLLILGILRIFDSIIEDRFTRIKNPFSEAGKSRFELNYFLSKGVLKESPFFGISRKNAWDFLHRYVDISPDMYTGTDDAATPSHHNQVGYYLRYYGLIGLALLGLLYLRIFQKISRSPGIATKMMLFSIFLFDFQYSMGHNNKLITNMLLWMLLSQASGDNNENER